MSIETETTIERLKELQNDYNMSERKFATFVGAKKSTLHSWLSGDIGTMKANKVAEIAKKCNVSPLWLMGLDVPKEMEDENHKGLRNKINDELLSATNLQLKQIQKFIEDFVLVEK
jgi:transcriptional regulator with XRE-family HTH domain